MTFETLNTITSAADLTAAKAEHAAAKAKVDAAIVKGAVAGDFNVANYAKLAAQKIEIDRYNNNKVLADADISTDLAAATASLNGLPGVATSLILGTPTAGSTLTWSSGNETVLTNAGVAKSNGLGHGASLTVKVTKTVNGVAGTEQTKRYWVDVNNANGTITLVTLQ